MCVSSVPPPTPFHGADLMSPAPPRGAFRLPAALSPCGVRPIDMARDLSIVTMLLPEIDGELAYRIRNPNEPHERIAKESELYR